MGRRIGLLEFIAYTTLLSGVVVLGIFLYTLNQRGATIVGDVNLGQLSKSGDFIAGSVGTLLTLAGTLFIILTFRDQNRENATQRFEDHFYEMIRIHRDNVDQLIYRKELGKTEREYRNRQVFKVIVDEFEECYKEISHFNLGANLNTSLKVNGSVYEKIIKERKLSVSPADFLIVDLCYTIIYFGIGETGMHIVYDRFEDKLDSAYLLSLLQFLSLKPLKSHDIYRYWKTLDQLHINAFKVLNASKGEVVHDTKKEELELAQRFKDWKVKEPKYTKYYGGHQHRLGHYYRHLYQAFKYLHYTKYMSSEDKYNHGKLFRAQLSTHEQILLFLNSISTLGLKWELFHSKDQKADLISTYQLIKNVPGERLNMIRYKFYYPAIELESGEIDI